MFLTIVFLVLNVIIFVVGLSGLCNIFINGYENITDVYLTFFMTVVSGVLFFNELSGEIENE